MNWGCRCQIRCEGSRTSKICSVADVFFWILQGEETPGDDLYGFQTMRTQSSSELNANITEDDDVIAAALQNEELSAGGGEEPQNMDTFSQMYEFFSSLWRGEETKQRKRPQTYDYHREILPTSVQFDIGLRIEHFGTIVEPESQGASFKPLNFCQQPTNVYISAATCRECLPLHQGELPSSFLAYLHRMWPPAERAEARKKQQNKASNPTSKEETGLDDTTTVGSYFTHTFSDLERGNKHSNVFS